MLIVTDTDEIPTTRRCLLYLFLKCKSSIFDFLEFFYTMLSITTELFVAKRNKPHHPYSVSQRGRSYHPAYQTLSSLGQMALESTTCGIVHHARRTRAHCPTMVSSFKLSSGTVAVPYQCSLALGRNHKSYLSNFVRLRHCALSRAR